MQIGRYNMFDLPYQSTMSYRSIICVVKHADYRALRIRLQRSKHNRADISEFRSRFYCYLHIFPIQGSKFFFKVFFPSTQAPASSSSTISVRIPDARVCVFDFSFVTSSKNWIHKMHFFAHSSRRIRVHFVLFR